MTISNLELWTKYNGDGSQTSFALPGASNSFSDNSEIRVELIGADSVITPQVLNTDFTVVGGNPGSQILMTVAPAVGEDLVIYRESAETQLVDFIGTGPFPSETNERALDKLTRLVQEALYKCKRALKVRIDDEDSLDMPFPTRAERAGTYLGFDSNGDPIAATGADLPDLLVSAYIETLLDDADAPTARNTLGLGDLAVLDTVDTAQIDDDAVTAAKLAADSVITAKILDENVTANKLATDAVTTAKIQNDAVTNEKIADNAVGQSQIADSAVVTSKINDSAVTVPKLAAATLRRIARAWANFNGAAQSGTYNLPNLSNIVTVTIATHGLLVGQIVTLDFTSGTMPDGTFTVLTVPTANTFTIDAGFTENGGGRSGNVTKQTNIRASEGVTSFTDNSTGDWTMNLTSALSNTSAAPTMTAAYVTIGTIENHSEQAWVTSTTAIRFQLGTGGGVLLDSPNVYCHVFGD